MGGGAKYSVFTWFAVLALLGVWSSVAVVYFDIVDYDSVVGKRLRGDTAAPNAFVIRVIFGACEEARRTTLSFVTHHLLFCVCRLDAARAQEFRTNFSQVLQGTLLFFRHKDKASCLLSRVPLFHFLFPHIHPIFKVLLKYNNSTLFFFSFTSSNFIDKNPEQKYYRTRK